ncbi:MAG: isochorismatase family protein [Burkholderiales bacterium]
MHATALLVIDIQRGAFDGVRCPRIDRSVELVSRANTLIKAARRSGTPVVFIQHCDDAGEAFEEGTPHREFHEEITPLPNDTIVKKRASSAFEQTNLQSALADLGIKNLIRAGRTAG